MFQTFNTDTLVGRLVKNIIYNTKIPKYKTVCDGDWLFEDCFYAFGNTILKCTSSGYLKIDSNSDVTSDMKRADYKVISNMVPGQPNRLTTENWMSKNTYYDHETHEMLGEYLRYLRSKSNVDLMPFYNCFSGYYTSTFYIRNGEYWEGVNNTVQVALFPIKFNKKYTVAIDCPSGLELLPVILSDGVPLQAVYGGQLVNLTEELSSFYINKPTTSFKQPFLFSVDIDDSNPFGKYMEQNERSLYLALQIPRAVVSSIVVLEGDYTNSCQKIYDRDFIDRISESQKNKIFLSELSLLRINDKNSYAFSDKLIEYLTLNVVTPDEDIEGNITFAQKVMPNYVENMYPGVWEDSIRYGGYDFYMNAYQEVVRLQPVDINGYFDKDIEHLLLKRLTNA